MSGSRTPIGVIPSSQESVEGLVTMGDPDGPVPTSAEVHRTGRDVKAITERMGGFGVWMDGNAAEGVSRHFRRIEDGSGE